MARMKDANHAVQSLAREIRQATGYERTPSQILEALFHRRVNSVVRACEKICADPDMVQAFAKNIRLKDQDDIPSSVSLDMGFS